MLKQAAKNKKNPTQDVKPKAETNKPVLNKKEDEDQPEDTGLVHIDYNQKQDTLSNNKKVEVKANKLDQKEVDVSNIPNQKKKEEKPVITSWVVNQDKVKDLVAGDYKHKETEFQSIFDTKINQELQEKKQKLMEEEKVNPKVQEINGFKYAPLQVSQKQKVDANEPALNLSKKIDTSPISGIPISTVPVKTFINSKTNNNNIVFAELEKGPQQKLLEEQKPVEKEKQVGTSVRRKSPELTMKGKGTGGWLGTKTTVEEATKAPENFKVSSWVPQGSVESNENSNNKFAPIQKSNQEMKLEQAGRKEQEFKFVSKKEQQERKKIREEKQKLQKEKPVEEKK